MPAATVFSRASTTPMHVLLAEDHDEFRELIARGLEADGAVVQCVADGEAALERLLSSEAAPDVVVSDVRMPRRSGLDVLRTARSAGIATPFILLTGFGQSVARADVSACGGAVLLEKPFDFDDLRTALLNLSTIARLSGR